MFRQDKPKDGFAGALSALENWCVVFNNFAIVFFWYMKFIFSFIFLAIGTLTLLKLRGIYKFERTTKEAVENKLKRARFTLGIFYLTAGLGILLNYLTYFLIWILDPLPDRFIFDFINFSGYIDPKYLNRIEDIEASKYPHEKTIYYCVAIASLGAILDVVISIAFIVNNDQSNHRRTFAVLIGGVTLGILTGWTTCLPFFL